VQDVLLKQQVKRPFLQLEAGC